ncbi:response regulator transcription factor [Kitasatospora sp. NA04385]|uniref:response regulator n=1 Tax=Kitasatospora sp. NA04385 TaxID=2742135 RepID=UPI0015928E7E|nr:response regulator transcription factor [Kitasatospora sp. NA04385]QKW22742.1 response regulator transcription factor [Kitasatospora sp. NA04385]
MAVTVLLADDEDLMRAGLRMLLGTRADLRVVGEAADGAQAVRLAVESRPDVVLMDVRMPVLDGVAATAELSARCPQSRVLVLTTFESDAYVFAAVRAGAAGFLLKRTPPEQLLHGIRTVASGEALLSPSVTRRLLAEFARSAPPPAAPAARAALRRLTPREHQVLQLLGRGRSNREIAAALHLGEATVKTHVRRVLDKLGVRDRIHAVVFAFDHGVVRPGPHPGAGGE